MRKLYLFIALLAFAQLELSAGEAGLHLDNDFFSSEDANYTGGWRLFWEPKTEPGISELLRKTRWIPWGRGTDSAYKYFVGQEVYTPSDDDALEAVEGDRPYAGWLYGGLVLSEQHRSCQDTLELSVGLVGEWAFAEDAQDGLHHLAGDDTFKGWDNQLDTEPTLQAFYRRTVRLAVMGHEGWGVDLLPHTGAALGNVAIHLDAGYTMRLGWQLPDHYHQARVAFGPDDNEGFASWLYASGNARLVGRNLFLDGNTFSDSHSVDKEPFVGEVAAGLGLDWAGWIVRFSNTWRTNEWEDFRDSNFTTITVGASW